MDNSECEQAWFTVEDLDKKYDDSLCECCQSGSNSAMVNSCSIEELVPNEILVEVLHSELAKITEFLSFPFVFFLTDRSGNIMDIVSPFEKVHEKLEHFGIKSGTNLSKQFSGLNAVSLAMEVKSIAVVRGYEHNMPMFKEWNCVCAPIKVNGLICGYINISFEAHRPIGFSILFIKQLSEKIVLRLKERSPGLIEYSFQEKCNSYHLSPRERDVAYHWSLRKGALQISNDLNVTEGTVRNIVKSIYSKMNISERWELIELLKL
ncbi:LuxR C-terminal-related transcriptional regulator [Paenibacillus sp. FSL R10-2734]|uniref:helix-turn-helix transcriptional regulator n=1 Tax=Paenibacillus sp. FSL R10-2734 TaxID=2954691 RepID=UPI0030DCB06E